MSYLGTTNPPVFGNLAILLNDGVTVARVSVANGFMLILTNSGSSIPVAVS